MKCDYCNRLSYAAGQAFTKYRCGQCFKAHMHANTATPKLCRECSQRTERCERCLNKIGEPICSCGKQKDMCCCVNSTIDEV